MPISHRKGFYIYKKTNNIFLKFHHYLFGMPKIVEIGWIFHSKNANQKHNQHAYKYGSGHLNRDFNGKSKIN